MWTHPNNSGTTVRAVNLLRFSARVDLSSTWSPDEWGGCWLLITGSRHAVQANPRNETLKRQMQGKTDVPPHHTSTQPALELFTHKYFQLYLWYYDPPFLLCFSLHLSSRIKTWHFPFIIQFFFCKQPRLFYVDMNAGGKYAKHNSHLAANGMKEWHGHPLTSHNMWQKRP